MEKNVMKFVVALGLAGMFALTAANPSFAKSRMQAAGESQRSQVCVPQYDSAGVQAAPYCY